MHHKNGRPIHHSIWTKIEFFKFFRHSVIISHHFQIEHWSKTIEQQLKCMVKCRLCMLFCIRCIVGAQLTWSSAKTVITYKYGCNYSGACDKFLEHTCKNAPKKYVWTTAIVDNFLHVNYQMFWNFRWFNYA